MSDVCHLIRSARYGPMIAIARPSLRKRGGAQTGTVRRLVSGKRRRLVSVSIPALSSSSLGSDKLIKGIG